MMRNLDYFISYLDYYISKIDNRCNNFKIITSIYKK